MTNIDHLLDRNRAFADTDARQDVPALPFLPRQGLYIVICIDCRVNPAQILGIELGDALVQRNIGGRVTPAVIRDIAYAAYLVETKAPQGPWFEVAVIHHTDCGSTLLADDELRHGFAQRIGVTSGPSPTRRCWTRRAPSAPTCSGSCGRRRSRRTCRSPVTSTTSRPAWSPPSSTESLPAACLDRNHRHGANRQTRGMTTEPALLVCLDLGGTFIYAVNGGLTAVCAARLDIVGVVTVAMVSGLGGGIIRDILLGALPPATFSDWRYLAVATAGGMVAFALSSQLARLATLITVLDAAGLGLFAVTGASKALGLGLGAAPAVILGAVTGVGGGTLQMCSWGRSRRCCGEGCTPSRPCAPP